MTAFADRTVVTIAVRGPLVGCRETPRERAGLLRLSSVGSPWDHWGLVIKGPWSWAGQGVRKVCRGPELQDLREGGFVPACPSDRPSHSPGSQATPVPRPCELG